MSKLVADFRFWSMIAIMVTAFGSNAAVAADCSVVERAVDVRAHTDFIAGIGLPGEGQSEYLTSLRANSIGRQLWVAYIGTNDKPTRVCINEVYHTLRQSFPPRVAQAMEGGFVIGLLPEAKDYVERVMGIKDLDRAIETNAKKILNDIRAAGGVIPSQQTKNPGGSGSNPSLTPTTDLAVSLGPEYDRCDSDGPSMALELTPQQLFGDAFSGSATTKIIMFGDLANDNDILSIRNILQQPGRSFTIGGTIYMWARCGKPYTSDTYPALTKPICGCTADGGGKEVATQAPTSPPTGSSGSTGIMRFMKKRSGAFSDRFEESMGVGDH